MNRYIETIADGKTTASVNISYIEALVEQNAENIGFSDIKDSRGGQTECKSRSKHNFPISL